MKKLLTILPVCIFAKIYTQFRKRRTLCILVSLHLSILALAQKQFPTVDLPGTQVRKITSAIVAGQEYELDISLPAGYNTNKKYPVLYVMDSQWDFPLVRSIYGQQYY